MPNNYCLKISSLDRFRSLAITPKASVTSRSVVKRSYKIRTESVGGQRQGQVPHPQSRFVHTDDIDKSNVCPVTSQVGVKCKHEEKLQVLVFACFRLPADCITHRNGTWGKSYKCAIFGQQSKAGLGFLTHGGRTDRSDVDSGIELTCSRNKVQHRFPHMEDI